MDAYFQTKSASILTAIELSKRSNGQINAYSVHPGSNPCWAYIDVLTTDHSPLAIYTNIMQNTEEVVSAMQQLGLFIL
jgi:hypothetical protein